MNKIKKKNQSINAKRFVDTHSFIRLFWLVHAHISYMHTWSPHTNLHKMPINKFIIARWIDTVEVILYTPYKQTFGSFNDWLYNRKKYFRENLMVFMYV